MLPQIILTALVIITPFILADDISNLLSKFNQTDYTMHLERAELHSCDKKYLSDCRIVSFKYNRTAFAINSSYSLSTDVGYDGLILTQFYKFLSNEYRHFPVRFQVPYCDFIKHQIFGFGDFACGDFTGCPAVKGKNETFCNWAIDYKKGPPSLTSGRYMIEMSFLYKSTPLTVTRMYVEVKHPISHK